MNARQVAAYKLPETIEIVQTVA